MSSARTGSGAEGLKRAAAAEALGRVRSGMVVGLGTGSTIAHFLELLGGALARGELEDVRGIPTSEATRERARELGIPLTDLESAPAPDLAIDGADEVDPGGRLIKGMGGALLREKIVAHASDGLVVIVDEGKLVDRLGTRSPLPVEVVPFGWTLHRDHLRSLGADPSLRRDSGGEPAHTDNGHLVLDVRFPDGVTDPAALDRDLQGRPGIVETGLFLGLTREVVVGGADGVRVLEGGRRGAKS